MCPNPRWNVARTKDSPRPAKPANLNAFGQENGMGQPDNTEALNAYEAAVDQAIATCGGDLRATIKALLIANEFLESELERVSVQVSNGYARGRARLRSS